MFYIWLVSAFIFFLFELMSPGLFLFLSFSVGALAAAIIAGVYYSFTKQLVAFVITTLISIFVSMFWVARVQRSKMPKTNSDLLLGKSAPVIQAIHPHEFGQVYIDGQIWSAKAAHPQLIPKNTNVIVIAVSGAHVIVEKVK